MIDFKWHESNCNFKFQIQIILIIQTNYLIKFKIQNII